MIYYEQGAPDKAFGHDELRKAVFSILDRLGERRKVLAIPPDFTRFHSRAGELTRYIYEYYGEHLTDILPAIGTHFPMTDGEIEKMFPGIPRSLFRVHDWRNDVVHVGTVPADYVGEVSGGVAHYPMPM